MGSLKALSPAKAINLGKMDTTFNEIARLEAEVTDSMPCLLRFTQTIEEKHFLQFDDARLLNIAENKITPNVFGYNFSIDLLPLRYITAFEVMINHDELLLVLMSLERDWLTVKTMCFTLYDEQSLYILSDENIPS